MNLCATPHEHYCGGDLHARTMYVCILSQKWAFSEAAVLFVAKSSQGKTQRFMKS